MNKQRILYLLNNYRHQQLTSSEAEELQAFLADEANKEIFADAVSELFNESTDIPAFNEDLLPYLHKTLAVDKVAEAPVHHIHFLKRSWLRYAAAIIVIAGVAAIALILTSDKQSPTSKSITQSKPIDVPPGGDKATLTLADGTNIILDSAANGSLAMQGGVQVSKLANGQLSYNMQKPATNETLLNTLNTPTGGQYQVILPDGTRVWLNAKSSITFPAAFTGNERKVKIDGEVYFEVTKNQQKPFIVDVHGESMIEVLGTSFNINSYQDEPSIKATLVAGSVRVSKNNEKQILASGQQAIIKSSGQQEENISSITLRSNVDLDQIIAWKDGFFSLEDLDLYTVMRKLERWYDIKVRYEGSVKNIIFQGKIYRNTNLSDVLYLLNKMGVRFRMEEKTLIVF